MPSIECIRKKAEGINLVNATAKHAKLLYDIFTGFNIQRYSPVGKVSVDDLAQSLGEAGRAFSDRAAFYRFFGDIDRVMFGTFVLKDIDWENREGEIGFSLFDKWQGQGLGSALVYKSLVKIFQESEIDRIWGTVSINNEACKKMMQRIGFRDCGFYGERFFIDGEWVRQIVYRMNRKQANHLLKAVML